MICTEELVGTITELVELAPRATGTPGGVAAAEYVRDRLIAAGLDEVWIESDEAFRWQASRVGVRVGHQDVPAAPVLHCQLPAHDAVGAWSTGPDGLTAEVVDVGSDRVVRHDVRGRLVLFDLRFTMSQASLLPLTEYVHDPGRRMLRRDVLTSRNPYMTTLTRVMTEAKAQGAVGVIGVLAEYPESLAYHNEYYRRSLMELPGVWVTRAGGARLRALLREDPRATLTLDSTRERVRSATAVGVLRGRSAETIMVQSHHDSVGPGAVEDASGTAEVIAIAEEEVARARRRGPREKTLMFVTFDTHFTGYQAHQRFARQYALDPHSPFPLALNLTIEHVGLRSRVGAHGGFETLHDTEPRAFFENVGPALKWQLIRTIRRRGLRSTSVLNATALEFLAGGIPTDASFILASGVPTISLVSGPLYLYDDADTIEQVDVEQLAAVGRAFVDLIDAADHRPAGRIGFVPRRVRRLLPRGRW
ncbi:M28 family peptidase [Mycolicibacter arupensis]|uniref:M28 family peptidase n=1 Tax=Mycolicibacter arupensis TaxID=342002 RepID=UPI003B3B90F1